MNIDYQELFFDAEDGLRLFFRRWFVPGPKGLVAVVHGFAEHSGRYQQLAEDLCQAGWSVAAFDCRGHGQSGGRRAHIDRFDAYLHDLFHFLDEIGQHGFEGRPVLLGHSQGGLIAARFVELHAERVSGLVLSSPFLGLAVKVPAIKAWAGKALSGVMPTLALKSGVDPAWLSHDQEVVARYAADPLVSNIATARWFTEVTAAQQATLEDAGRVRLPLLVLQAGDDRLAAVGATRSFFERAGSQDKFFEQYEGFYHEVFNEVGRERPVTELCDWLDTHR